MNGNKVFLHVTDMLTGAYGKAADAAAHIAGSIRPAVRAEINPVLMVIGEQEFIGGDYDDPDVHAARQQALARMTP